MADRRDEASSAEPSSEAGTVRNIGEPLRFTNIEPLMGFAAEAAKGGQQIKVWTKLALTSDEPLFHRLVENLANVVDHMANQAGVNVNVRRVDTLLLILKPDAIAELWLDTAAVSIRCALKRPVAAGEAVYDRDIVDITEMNFPGVAFGAADKVLCLFREGWRFGFAFDMNPDGKLDLYGFTAALGALLRELRYKHLYDAISEQGIFEALLGAGWFPFAEIITSEFGDLVKHCEAGFDLSEVEDKILSNFDTARMQRILERWIAKPHFAAKAALLKAAIGAYCAKEPISVIKILLTEIEGVLNDAYRAANGGKGAKLKELLVFAEASAERKAGGANTLLFPRAFGRYLRGHTFVAFDPVGQTGTAGSRHAVGHGAASQDSYTMTRALQAILTLDHLAFYT